MKFYESHFENYIIENKRVNLHPKLEKIIDKFPLNINKLKNIIIYGPNGIGKYTQVLKFIKKYSLFELKYEKKINISFNKQNFFVKISDIHYEVDMSLLGCNSKLLWHEIYLQIIDIISAKTEKAGIIVCKYFQEIHSELLDNFYSYMQKNYSINVNIVFFIITEELSFIPDNILNCCEVISISRPSISSYNKLLKNKLPKNSKLDEITNIKNLYLLNEFNNVQIYYKIICDKILEHMILLEDIHFLHFRDLLYDIFIYQLDITDCIWYIINNLIKKNYLKQKQFTNLMITTYCFFQYYNNNYRPIYHLENYLLKIIQMMNE
jgi:hypothetical protein